VKINFVFSELSLKNSFLPVLEEASQQLELSLSLDRTDCGNNVVVSSTSTFVFSNPSIRLAVGDLWNLDQLQLQKNSFHTVETFTLNEAKLFLLWCKSVFQMKSVGASRHELANLIVILLGRILRMKNSEPQISEEHLKSLEGLHARLTSLSEDLDKIDVPRSS
jgi:hypothetical protein